MSERQAWARGFDEGWYAALQHKPGEVGETIPNPYPEPTEPEFEYAMRSIDEGHTNYMRFTSAEYAQAWIDGTIEPGYWEVVRRPKADPWEVVK